MDADALIRDLAAGQHGLVARRQLVGAGVPAHAIDYRLEKGRLVPIHRSVYRVGPLTSIYEQEMGAVLTCGTGAVLSHHSAGLNWQLLAQAATGPVDVTIGRGYRVSDARVRVHRSKLTAGEVTVLHHIPITTPARTLLDIASDSDDRGLEQALAQADRQRLASRQQIEQLLELHPRRAGTPRLRALLACGGQPALIRSEAEARFLSLIRKAQVRAPEANVMIEGYEVDFLWRMERLVAEVDGRAFHSSKLAFERDRRRDGVLTAAGLRVMRVTWQQLSAEPEALLVRLALALARSSP